MLQGVKTSEPSLADATGHLARDQMCNHDQQLKTILESGWQWTIIQACVEEVLPDLPNLIQSAKNASNSSFETMGELELMAALAEQAAKGPVESFEKLAAKMCPDGVVSTYARTLGKFVELFAGGPGGPLIQFMSQFAKQFGEGGLLGQDFVVTLTNMSWSKVNLFPLSRVGFMLCNLTTHRITDGVSKLVTKTDLVSLKGKKVVELEKLESHLQQWWNEAKKKDISTNKVCKAFGKAMLRACLHVLGKGLLGREEVDHDSLNDIGDLFMKALTSSSLPASTAAAPPQTPSGTMISLSEAQSPMFLAQKATGLAVGKPFMLKDYPDRVWTCIKLGDSGATFEHIDVLSQQSCKVQVPVLELCEKVKSTKAKPLQLIRTDVMDNLFATVQCLEESEKATLYNLLLECYNSCFALGSAFVFTCFSLLMSFV